MLFEQIEDGRGLTLTTAERVDMTLTALEQITDWATWRHVVFSTGFRSVRGRALRRADEYARLMRGYSAKYTELVRTFGMPIPSHASDGASVAFGQGN